MLRRYVVTLTLTLTHPKPLTWCYGGGCVLPRAVVTASLAAEPREQPAGARRGLAAAERAAGLGRQRQPRLRAGGGERAAWVDAESSLVTLRARWVTLRARWVTLRARWVTLRARWVTPRARWVTLRARWVTLRARWVTLRARW
jgi:hypothetical protein